MSYAETMACVVAITACLSWGVTDAVRRHALRHSILDIPNARSAHAVPTPRGGGLAIVATFMCAVAFLMAIGMLRAGVAWVLLLGGGSIALVGYLDDRRPMPALVRFCVHLGAAALGVFVLGGVAEESLRHVGLHGIWAGGALALVVLSWSTNMFNFMDGIDGIAGSEAVFAASAGALINWRFGGDPGLTGTMLILAAATLGFLIWNWPPARIFMGDAGSGFLGFTLALLGLAASRAGPMPIEVWAILGAVFLVDATVTLITRAARGEPWFEAHSSHTYQALARRWNGHLRVTRWVIAIDVLWLLPWAWAAASRPAHALACMAAALAPLVALAVGFGAGHRPR
ncbi:MAG TPA: glycosyltransferase family 4 protein [Steroidobacteraceae bacterium]|nr:glycosyltransferase family 4 protein [Steroidobacteraceae bacterium]